MSTLQKIITVLCAIISMIAPMVVIACIALLHNPQNKYINENETIEWSLLILVISPAFIIGLVLSCIVTMITLFIIKILNQRKTSSI